MPGISYRIDRKPPEFTGDLKKDCAAMTAYCSYLQERMNFILTCIDRELKQTGGEA